MRKKLLLTIGLGLIFCGSLLAAPAPKTYTVVIDAGHGGKDPGAVGKVSYEKDLNLAVALIAGGLIQEAYPDIRVLYTRDKDVFLPLQDRADFVNKNNADLFICIHTNSAESRQVKGVETFVLGTDRMEGNLDVAMRENAVIKLEANYQTTYQGFDPNSIDSYIMFELMQNTYMDQSLQFAALTQQQFTGSLKRADRGVRQAAFWVLLKSACPSVLVEMGFISNPEEEAFLLSKEGQQKMGESIFNAFKSYYRKPSLPEQSNNKNNNKNNQRPQQKNQGNKPAQQNGKPAQQQNAKSAPSTQQPQQREVVVIERRDTVYVNINQVDTLVRLEQALSEEEIIELEWKRQQEREKQRTQQQKPNQAKPASAKQNPPKQNPPAKPQTQSQSQPAQQPSPAADQPKPAEGAQVYAVQIFVSRRILPDGDSNFKGHTDCKWRLIDGLYKYHTGETTDYNQVLRTRRALADTFPGCFVVKL